MHTEENIDYLNDRKYIYIIDKKSPVKNRR